VRAHRSLPICGVGQTEALEAAVSIGEVVGSP
jgi:hypothetical protein